MLDYKIIATDIDGTLLDDNKQLSKENEQAIIDLVKSGHIFLMNSGALPKDAKKIITLSKVGINDGTKWFVGLNGLVVYNFETSESFVDLNKNSLDEVKKLIEPFKDIKWDIKNLEGENYLHFSEKDDDKWYNFMLALYPLLQDDTDKLKGFNRYLTVMDDVEHKKYSYKDIIYFGDNLNDLPVFSFKDIKCVAVDNAIDQIKKLADDTTTEKTTGIHDYFFKK